MVSPVIFSSSILSSILEIIQSIIFSSNSANESQATIFSNGMFFISFLAFNSRAITSAISSYTAFDSSLFIRFFTKTTSSFCLPDKNVFHSFGILPSAKVSVYVTIIVTMNLRIVGVLSLYPYCVSHNCQKDLSILFVANFFNMALSSIPARTIFFISSSKLTVLIPASTHITPNANFSDV